MELFLIFFRKLISGTRNCRKHKYTWGTIFDVMRGGGKGGGGGGGASRSGFPAVFVFTSLLHGDTPYGLFFLVCFLPCCLGGRWGALVFLGWGVLAEGSFYVYYLAFGDLGLGLTFFFPRGEVGGYRGEGRGGGEGRRREDRRDRENKERERE
jgi:hypothetical protein